MNSFSEPTICKSRDIYRVYFLFYVPFGLKICTKNHIKIQHIFVQLHSVAVTMETSPIHEHVLIYHLDLFTATLIDLQIKGRFIWNLLAIRDHPCEIDLSRGFRSDSSPYQYVIDALLSILVSQYFFHIRFPTSTHSASR